MAEVLATTDDVAARLPFVMSPEELRECEGALADLSDEARYYGSGNWTEETRTPNEVKNLILKACARHMKNYEGYISNRAGDETVAWAQPRSTDEVGSARFSPAERQRLSDLGGRQVNRLHSVNTFAYQTRLRGRQLNVNERYGYGALTWTDEGFVPDETGADGFPLFSDDEEPW
jgi:hypothetical protein